jgi:hypothetical protein
MPTTGSRSAWADPRWVHARVDDSEFQQVSPQDDATPEMGARDVDPHLIAQ